jgi:hypothetical protein
VVQIIVSCGILFVNAWTLKVLLKRERGEVPRLTDGREVENGIDAPLTGKDQERAARLERRRAILNM